MRDKDQDSDRILFIAQTHNLAGPPAARRRGRSPALAYVEDGTAPLYLQTGRGCFSSSPSYVAMTRGRRGQLHGERPSW